MATRSMKHWHRRTRLILASYRCEIFSTRSAAPQRPSTAHNRRSGAARAGIKKSSKAIRGGELPRIGFVSNKSTYENTHPVRRDLCSGWTLVLHDRGQGTGGHDHDYPYGDGGRTHSDQHEYDCDQAKRRRLLSRQFEFVAKRGTPHASPFFVVASYYIEGYRCYPSLGRCFGFFDCLLTNDWRDCL
jgi:hypothetical protein